MRIAMIGSGYVGLVSGACFAQFGHDVACVDKEADKVARLKRGEMPIYEPGLDRLVADTVREFGTVDILVNNAGLFADLAMKPFMDIDDDEWDRVMKVNVRGSFQCAKAVAPVMMEKKRGRIVNRLQGDPAQQLHERHDASDFDTKTQDKVGAKAAS